VSILVITERDTDGPTAVLVMNRPFDIGTEWDEWMQSESRHFDEFLIGKGLAMRAKGKLLEAGWEHPRSRHTKLWHDSSGSKVLWPLE